MKYEYNAPEAQVIDLLSVEQIAALDGHPDEQSVGQGNDDYKNPSLGTGDRDF